MNNFSSLISFLEMIDKITMYEKCFFLHIFDCCTAQCCHECIFFLGI